MKEREYTFCMKQFKGAVVGLAILVVAVLAWTGWHCAQRRVVDMNLSLAAAAIPPAKRISVKDKTPHPYWGNCNKCHITIDAGRPVSKVMAGASISIKDKMLHKYWGNCLLCHKVIDGFQPKKRPRKSWAAAANRLTPRSLGLKVQTVTGAMMRKFGLAKEDGVLVLEVAPNSISARAGLQKGDEIIRAGKVRTESANSFDAALNRFKPGSRVKINIYRGKKSRNLIVKIPNNVSGYLNTAAATTPMTQNQVETRAEQLGVPKTQQDVARALQRQKQTRAVANLNYGKVAVAASGPGLGYQVSHQFGASPYFIIYDPGQNSYRIMANPNANDATGRGIQTGQYVVDQGVSNVVAGNFSQDALHTLHILRVNVYSGVTGFVQDVLSSYRAGEMAVTNTAQSLRVALPGRNTSPRGGGQNVVPIY